MSYEHAQENTEYSGDKAKSHTYHHIADAASAMGSTASGALLGGAIGGIPGALFGGAVGLIAGVVTSCQERRKDLKNHR